MGAVIIIDFRSLMMRCRPTVVTAGEEWSEFETWIFLVERGPGIQCTYVSVFAVLNDQKSKRHF